MQKFVAQCFSTMVLVCILRHRKTSVCARVVVVESFWLNIATVRRNGVETLRRPVMRIGWRHHPVVSTPLESEERICCTLAACPPFIRRSSAKLEHHHCSQTSVGRSSTDPLSVSVSVTDSLSESDPSLPSFHHVESQRKHGDSICQDTDG